MKHRFQIKATFKSRVVAWVRNRVDPALAVRNRVADQTSPKPRVVYRLGGSGQSHDAICAMRESIISRDRPLRGIGLMLAALAFFSCSDAASKLMTEPLPAIEVAWLHFGVFTFLMLGTAAVKVDYIPYARGVQGCKFCAH